MDETDIEKLFLSVVESPRQNDKAARQVFSVLVKSTLRYRDEVLESQGIVVTVDDVRTCLGWLIPALATGNMPETDNEIGVGLLDIWMKELRDAGLS